MPGIGPKSDRSARTWAGFACLRRRSTQHSRAKTMSGLLAAFGDARLQSGRRNERAVLDFIPSPHRLHSLGSAGRRSRRQWGSACAMRLARSAASCNQGWPGPPKIAQRRRDGWLRSGRRDPGRRRRLGQCVKTRITRRCAVRACFSTALKQGWARARTQTTQGGDMAGLHSSGSQAVNVS